ncbi:hypothetical protein ACIPYS_08320 [Kitasatospora sp. NPDC089913]|uniref:hypothetical protein n=1 Tax=Kitasatospora sp. NPDC089913 TaxID=3364080 RepID=UPI00382DC144
MHNEKYSFKQQPPVPPGLRTQVSPGKEILRVANEWRPGEVYRFDDRHPDDVFTNGLTARGTHYDLVKHIAGDDFIGRDTGLISTTTSVVLGLHLFKEARRRAFKGLVGSSIDLAIKLLEEQGFKIHKEGDSLTIEARDFWCYRIVPTKYYISAQKNIWDETRLPYSTPEVRNYAWEQAEWDAPYRILGTAVLDATKHTITVVMSAGADKKSPAKLTECHLRSTAGESRKNGRTSAAVFNPFTDPSARYDGIIGFNAAVPPGSRNYTAPANWKREREYWNEKGEPVQPTKL